MSDSQQKRDKKKKTVNSQKTVQANSFSTKNTTAIQPKLPSQQSYNQYNRIQHMASNKHDQEKLINKINEQFIDNNRLEFFRKKTIIASCPKNAEILKLYNKNPKNSQLCNINQVQQYFTQKFKSLNCYEVKWKFKLAGKKKTISWNTNSYKTYAQIICQSPQCVLNNSKNQKLKNIIIHCYCAVEVNYMITNAQQFLKKYPKYKQQFKNQYREYLQWQVKVTNTQCRYCKKNSSNINIYEDQLMPVILFVCQNLSIELETLKNQRQKLKKQKQKQRQERQRQVIREKQISEQKQEITKKQYRNEKQHQQSSDEDSVSEENYKRNSSYQKQQSQNSEKQNFHKYVVQKQRIDYSDDSYQQYDYAYNQRKRQEKSYYPNEYDQLEYENQKNYVQQQSTNYPYKRKQINALFREKNVINQPVYSVVQAQDYILQELQRMDEYGYDFRIEPYWDFSDKKKSKSNKRNWNKKMKRKVYLRMKCNNCKEEDGRPKVWTSILGTGQINFMVDHLEQFLHENPNLQSQVMTPEQQADKKQYPFCVRWNLSIYRMKCKDCLEWGQPFIYQVQLQALAKSFCFIIAQIVEDIQSNHKRHKDDRHKKRQVHKHQESLCQACQRGQCFNIPKGQQGKQSQT